MVNWIVGTSKVSLRLACFGASATVPADEPVETRLRVEPLVPFSHPTKAHPLPQAESRRRRRHDLTQP
jgi:hypothetical protein